MVHVWNMLPTASLSGTTPFQAFYKRKPDVSHLRVWGCTSYVHVQRDKRNSLQPHYEKCVFIGYPAGYKGWKFYNPVTKRTMISERADFDERYFPGTSKAQLEAVPSFACLPESPPIPDDTLSHSGLPPLQDEGGDNHFPPAHPKTPTPSASVPPEEKPVLPLPLPVIPPFIPPVIPPVTPPQIHAPLPVTPFFFFFFFFVINVIYFNTTRTSGVTTRSRGFLLLASYRGPKQQYSTQTYPA
ncbi:hypothetical protein Agabi119p4_9800 [Agaricus bisporus var. burnettii]|uniref:Retroviral polymerase SH3-like domain-containing protein n=1 Tax=Agaricus bisporus var. burnettii TaxID=192524 RepID=A0A8H7C4C1_AGABI|nr:hypothetical protein Agabi119p4_9800 [Agaricus bisporus var. burnettii]